MEMNLRCSFVNILEKHFDSIFTHWRPKEVFCPKSIRIGPHLHPEDKEDIYFFLFLDKQYKTFVDFFSEDLQAKTKDLPWILFLNILVSHPKISIPRKFFTEIVSYFQKKEKIRGNIETPSQLLTILTQKQHQSFMDEVSKRKEDLLISIQIAKSEKLEDQRIFYEKELKKITTSEFNTRDTNDKEIVPSEFNFSISDTNNEQGSGKSQAEKILEKQKSKKTRFKTKSPAPLEEQRLIESIHSQACSYHDQGKAEATDFAYLLRSMGETKLAIPFIYKKKDSSQKDWQLLDYLSFGDQHLYLIDHCALLKRKYAHHSDALFSVYYAEAIACWNLGEKNKAIDIMSQISSIRPNFKSAAEILSQWKEDCFE